MALQIINGRPPNFAQVLAVFPYAKTPGVIFTYGSALYCPGLPEIDVPLMAHETLHSQRQGADPDAWWSQYLESLDFRFDEERLAHIEEYRVVRETIPLRATRRRYLKFIATRLSGPLYNHLVTFAEAKRIITGGQE
jgi:hypothetical protein